MVGIRIYDELSFWQVLFNQKDADRDNDDVLVAMHDSLGCRCSPATATMSAACCPSGATASNPELLA